MELDRIYNVDCLVGMKEIPDKSVDAIICDLPYGVLNSASEGGSWDTIIPFESLWEQYNRIIKDKGAIVLFAQGMFTAKLMLSNEKMWRYNWVWNKCRATGFLNANRMPLRYHEDICVFYKSLPTYNPQMEALNGREPNHAQGNGEHSDTNRCYGGFNRLYDRTIPDKKHPGSIISIPAVHCGEDQSHPTQKPIDLMRYLILTYTNKDDIVLDSCIGSGTTAVACIREHRHYIGYELDKGYYEQAIKRVEREKKTLRLDF